MFRLGEQGGGSGGLAVSCQGYLAEGAKEVFKGAQDLEIYNIGIYSMIGQIRYHLI